MIRPNHPYTHAPRLPDGEILEIQKLTEDTSGPLELEIGPGRGGFMYERLATCSEVRLIGLEIRLKWATLVDDRLRARGWGSRSRVFAEDARHALPRLMPDGCLQTVFLHFPDPWWKKRHQKRLVIGEVLLPQIERLLQPEGVLYIQTDVEERAELYQNQVENHTALVSDGDLATSPIVQKNPYGARSNREHRADEDGLPVWRMRWRKSQTATTNKVEQSDSVLEFR
jgi:tRNA (guanine-N7-)-methyltransferase